MSELEVLITDAGMYADGAYEKNTFDDFLMFSIIYLSLNILVDFIILFTFHLKVINRIKYINDDLNMLFDILRIY